MTGIPVTAAGGGGDEDPIRFERLCRDLELARAALPGGYRAEIIGGRIVMSPWARGFHNRVLESLLAQLTPHVPPGQAARTTPGLFLFPRQSRVYGPDLHVADRTATPGTGFLLPGAALSLVAEQTSGATREADWTEKADVYGRAQVPVYLLLDMREATVTVFHDPTPGLGYRQRSGVTFGERVRVPEPFGFALDTAGWER
ncbi:Uma2 family endonuclease [Streptomyces litchfieldiae]|uniref:Uma2 family endonuclease n=1 Tax=Streptomyces litchfieldiae TaxID=3075543 RepID=A0ABU2MTD7_9ACTN|nr:Uma2 family endonuclease [Streptomyces sp. DSM 44938]MDT0344899.1 Uma2 family endonuclease [Streptomyces sp. DSM 44938]